MQTKFGIKTLSLNKSFYHLLTCKVKIETIPGFELMSTVKEYNIENC